MNYQLSRDWNLTPFPKFVVPSIALGIQIAQCRYYLQTLWPNLGTIYRLWANVGTDLRAGHTWIPRVGVQAPMLPTG